MVVLNVSRQILNVDNRNVSKSSGEMRTKEGVHRDVFECW